MQKPRVSIVAALGRNRELGSGNKLLWHIPADLKRFKALTLGHPVIMGRKTFESILAVLGKPLPGRTNIVVTRDSDYVQEGVSVAHSLKEALTQAAELDGGEIFIIGGGQIYEQALPHADRLYLTLIDDKKNADAFFPPYENMFTKMVSDEPRAHEGLRYRWLTLEK